MLEECRRLGITLVAFSPLGRGFLTGTLQSPAELYEGDIRRTMPRFQHPRFDENSLLLAPLDDLAAHLGCTRAQLALSWVLSKGTT